jgi:hypothetical protein
MNRRRGRRAITRLALVALWGAAGLGFLACTSSTTGPTETPTSTATIVSVVTTFRGAVVESNPVVIASPEVLNVEVKLALGMPADSRVTIYLCVMETASSIGVGYCLALSDAVADVQARGNVVPLGIRTFQTDGMPKTTSYVYVGLMDGVLPWKMTGASPPHVGDMFGNNRVLATFQIPRAVTFQ